MIDTTTPNSPGWWLKRLAERLDDTSKRVDMLDEYLRCENGIPITASKAVREAYRRLMRMARTNFAELLVEAVRERMEPVGFRTGAAGDDLGDAEAWRIWQANALDADCELVHAAMLGLADGFVIVGPVDREIDAPLITPEDPRQVVVEPDPRRRRRALAAAKFFVDDWTGNDAAYLYLPGGVVLTASRDRGQTGFQGFAHEVSQWTFTREQQLPAPVIPVVRFGNRLDMFGRSRGEFESHIGLLDRINYTILSRLEIATLQAFRQRALKGAPSEDEHGNEVNYDDIFEADPGAMWLLPEGSDLWESGSVDLGPIRQAIRDDIVDLAAVSRTPLYYLSSDATNGSAEGASLAREGLVFKTKDRLKAAGESWEQVMSLAFTFAGDSERARRTGMEVIWAAPERYSLAERFDAASKAKAAEVPWRTAMAEVLQYTPQQIANMEAERASDLLLAASLATPPAV